MATSRVTEEPAYVLHRYDWSESSLILEVFTRHYGRIALVAKGAKRPSSSLRSVLLPLQPLGVAFGGDAEIRTLRSAEWKGGHVMPTGEALLSGYFLNELLINLLARDDPHPKLFDVYAKAVQVIASAQGEVLQVALRAFELLLLREIGLLPQLDTQTATLGALHPDIFYSLVPEGGLRQAGKDDRYCLNGAQWILLQQAVQDVVPFAATLRACVSVTTELKFQLRAMLHYYCGVKILRTRKVMLDIYAL